VLFYGSKAPEKYDLVAYLADAKDLWQLEFDYNKRDIDCLEFETQAIKFWEKHLK
jgi:hypothetical protein